MVCEWREEKNNELISFVAIQIVTPDRSEFSSKIVHEHSFFFFIKFKPKIPIRDEHNDWKKYIFFSYVSVNGIICISSSICAAHWAK